MSSAWRGGQGPPCCMACRRVMDFRSPAVRKGQSAWFCSECGRDGKDGRGYLLLTADEKRDIDAYEFTTPRDVRHDNCR